MAIGVYYQPDSLTFEQYARFYERLDQYLQEKGLDSPEGALHLSLFGEDGQLAGFEVWESEQAYRNFEEVLIPILAEVGIQGAQAQIVPIHRLAQAEAEVPWVWPR
ncbi:MAG TPA: hypothetical protein VHU17_20510 [Acidimicrobiales bacterium]|jgi:hypothetical protein|nr:hypothetical protein [Acidimicrobiales bacterium]